MQPDFNLRRSVKYSDYQTGIVHSPSSFATASHPSPHFANPYRMNQYGSPTVISRNSQKAGGLSADIRFSLPINSNTRDILHLDQSPVQSFELESTSRSHVRLQHSPPLERANTLGSSSHVIRTSSKPTQDYVSSQTVIPSYASSHQINFGYMSEVKQKLDANLKLLEELHKIKTMRSKRQKTQVGSSFKHQWSTAESTEYSLNREDDKSVQIVETYLLPTGTLSHPESRVFAKKGPQTINSPIIKKTEQATVRDSNPIVRVPTVQASRSVSVLSHHSTLKSIPKAKLSDFILQKKLGEGKFGTVFRAVHKATNCLVALKRIEKQIVKSHLMVDQMILELKLQSCLNNPFILKQFGFFSEAEHLYVVLEYMPDGTLFSLLKKEKTLSLGVVATKVKQIVLAIEYMHDIGIAHRDIKPENIVVSNDVCKLCDFGWATFCDERRRTYCGTFDYAAPEILENDAYDMSVDMWCVGVLTYQLLAGKAPFFHYSRKQTMKRIMNVGKQKINYTPSFSPEARDFIDKLVMKQPQLRMKPSEALRHPFLREVILEHES